MPLPKRKKSHSRKRTRRAHDALVTPSFSICPICEEPKLPHSICPSCGQYKGVNYAKVSEKVEKTEPAKK